MRAGREYYAHPRKLAVRARSREAVAKRQQAAMKRKLGDLVAMVTDDKALSFTGFELWFDHSGHKIPMYIQSWATYAILKYP